MKYYKIFDIRDNNPCTLFHGINKSKKLPLNKWIKANVKIVDDGGTKYLSGFHVLKDKQKAIKYLNRFTNISCKTIVEVECKNIRKKQHSPHDVYLAEYMRINDKDWSKKYIK